MSAAAFALDIDRQWAAEQESLRDAVVSIGLQAIQKVVMKSPVGNKDKWTEAFKKVGLELEWYSESYVGGRFRGNWTLSFGSLDPKITETVDPNGSETIARLSGEMETYPQEGFPVIYLQNNLPYAERLEGGYSTQAPGGVVAITIAELAAIWERTEL